MLLIVLGSSVRDTSTNILYRIEFTRKRVILCSVIIGSLLIGNDEVILRQIFIIILGLNQKVKIIVKPFFL